MPGAFFEATLGPGSSSFILGVAFTKTWIAHRDTIAGVDVYFNDRFRWSNDGSANKVDFESVVWHKIGHALGLAHFGKLHSTPRAMEKRILLPEPS
jgi:hypothetical protein